MTDYRPTTLGYAILGLLHEEPRTGYAVRKVFETTPMAHYSSSPGSIYPALRRLKEEGLVRLEGVRSGAVHALTKKGMRVLQAWLEESVDPARVPWKAPELLLRFAFMGSSVDETTRVAFLEAFRDGAEAYAEELERFRAGAEGVIPLSAWLALGHGVEGSRADARWARRTLEELKRRGTA